MIFESFTRAFQILEQRSAARTEEMAERWREEADDLMDQASEASLADEPERGHRLERRSSYVWHMARDAHRLVAEGRAREAREAERLARVAEQAEVTARELGVVVPGARA